jgi:hypothetical protein
MSSAGDIKNGVMEYWSIGMLKQWSTETMEYWIDGVLECWRGTDKIPWISTTTFFLFFFPILRYSITPFFPLLLYFNLNDCVWR